ncbi:MAG: apolipoprotein N-acyltransferase [Cyclobacteriaceae bacterium]|nr:apolipoprotein N-acyltransferase [Cyclobacteriaceae bacterium]
MQVRVVWAVYLIYRRKYKLLFSLITFVLSWLSVEFISIRTGIPNPWFQLGNALAAQPQLIQFYEYTGVLGGTIWILLSNCLLFLFLSSLLKGKKSNLILQLSAFLCLLLSPILISSQIVFIPDSYNEEVLIINTHQSDKSILKVSFTELLSESVNNISEKTKYIIWPESIFESMISIANIEKSAIVRDVQKGLIKNDSVIFVCGLVLSDNDIIYNTALTINSENVSIYKKRQIAPFSEYKPLFIGTLKMFNWSDYEISPGHEIMRENNRISVNICYESIFGELIAKNCYSTKGKAIALISNEVWTTGASKLLLKICSMRAIENRKYILRSTNSGISSVIKPDGSIMAYSDSKKSLSHLKAEIFTNSYITFYMRNGDYIGFLSITVLMVLICFTTIFSFVRTPKIYVDFFLISQKDT